MPLVGKPAPDFKAGAVVDGAFKDVALSDYKGNDAAAKFKEIGAELIGASVDSQHSHLQWINADRKKGGLGGVNFPLLADVSKKIAKAYDVLIEDGADEGIALRGLFIIDGKGIVRSSIINDLPVGRNPEEVIRLVQAFKHTDANGSEVCPAAWKPGSKTMKPDPVGALEYFSTAN